MKRQDEHFIVLFKRVHDPFVESYAHEQDKIDDHVYDVGVVVIVVDIAKLVKPPSECVVDRIIEEERQKADGKVEREQSALGEMNGSKWDDGENEYRSA